MMLIRGWNDCRATVRRGHHDASKPSLIPPVVIVSSPACLLPFVCISSHRRLTAMTDGVKPLLKSQGSQARYDRATNMEGQKRKKVLVVGAGAAGMYNR